MIFVYAISSLNHNYIYVGQSDNVIRRFHEHNEGYEKTTKPYRPFLLIYSQECPNRKEARVLEKYLKIGEGKRFLRSLS